MDMQGERIFEVEELFFSTTDKHGKITSGNEVFARVSGYEPEDLIGSPHSKIRHHDMPRAVFRLLWDRIGHGKTISAYVKNRAKNGQYYWVLAFVSPIPDGYLSVRFKPTTEIIKTVEAIYHQIRQAELEIESQPGKTKDEAIAASSALLMEILNNNGYSDYDSFVEAAFVRDFCNRKNLLIKLAAQATIPEVPIRHPIMKLLTRISTGLSSIILKHEDFFMMEDKVAEVTNFIGTLSLDVQLAALNLTIKSEHSGIEAGPLTVIASWLRQGSTMIGAELEKLIVPINENLKQIKSGLFNIASSQLQVEMIEYFMREMVRLDEKQRGYSEEEGRKLITLLVQSADATFTSSLGKIRDLGTTVRNVSNSFTDLQREVVGLSLAHVNGRVECAKMPESLSLESILQEAMNGINQAKSQVSSLNTLFTSLDQLLSGFGTVIKDIQGNYKQLGKMTD